MEKEMKNDYITQVYSTLLSSNKMISNILSDSSTAENTPNQKCILDEEDQISDDEENELYLEVDNRPLNDNI